MHCLELCRVDFLFTLETDFTWKQVHEICVATPKYRLSNSICKHLHRSGIPYVFKKKVCKEQKQWRELKYHLYFFFIYVYCRN